MIIACLCSAYVKDAVWARKFKTVKSTCDENYLHDYSCFLSFALSYDRKTVQFKIPNLHQNLVLGVGILPSYGDVDRSTGKSLSEALIFASTSPQYDGRLNYKFNT